MNINELISIADDMRNKAHAPYSGYTVGAALISKDGRIFTGCNVENASYGAAMCAERTAFFKAVSEGATEFSAIAIAGGRAGMPCKSAYPCGICRQVMAEFCGDDFWIYIKNGENTEIYTLKELLPHAFSPDNLK